MPPREHQVTRLELIEVYVTVDIDAIRKVACQDLKVVSMGQTVHVEQACLDVWKQIPDLLFELEAERDEVKARRDFEEHTDAVFRRDLVSLIRRAGSTFQSDSVDVLLVHLEREIDRLVASMKPSMKPSEPSESPASISCSFCYKPQKEARRIIAGAGVYICDECVEMCHEIIVGEIIGGGQEKLIVDKGETRAKIADVWMPVAPRWHVCSASSGPELEKQLVDGWEPFAATQFEFFLRKRML